MKFTVLYKTPAENSLTLLWMNSPDRDVIAEAADAIDVLLREDAHLRGESRSDNERIMFVDPLAVRFEVDEQDRTVKVLTLWRFQKPE